MPQYSKTTWVDGSAPAISAANLNKLEQGVFDAIRQDGSTTMSAQLVTIAGTAATPAIAPTGDSNTGIFFPAADTIAFGEGGTEAVRITSAGNVGIGTASPAVLLHTYNANTAIQINEVASGGSGVAAIRLKHGNNYYGWYVDSANALVTYDYQTGAERMRITSAGSVGVGDFASNNPITQFSVSNITGGVMSVTTKRAAGSNASPLNLSYGFYGYLDSEKARITATERSANTNASDLSFLVKDSSDVMQTRMYISTTGNVGIGTQSPSVKLEVAGSVGSNQGLISLINNSSADGYSLLSLKNSGASGKEFYLGLGGNATTGSDLANKFYIFDASAGARMVINSSGNVGIGTTSPEAKFHVTDSSASSTTVGANVIGRFQSAGSNADCVISFSNGVNSVTKFGQNAGNFVWLSDNTTERMRLTSGGYLLIGYLTSNGAYPLQVNGQIFATSSTIATSDGRYKKDIVSLDGALDIVAALNPVQFNWKEHPVHKFNTEVPTIGFIAQEVAEVLKDKAYLTSVIKKSECTWETETGETVEREVTRDIETQVEREVIEEVDGEEIARTITETVIEQVTEIVSEPVKETHTEEFYGIAESNMIAILTKAIQELKAEVDALKAQLAK
jgi:hypothetical protein